MTKRKNLLFLATALSVLGICIVSIHVSNKQNNNFMFSVGDPVADLVLNDSQTPDTLTASYQNLVEGEVVTEKGNTINLGFVNAKAVDDNFVQLAPGGKIFNFQSGAEYGRQIKGITSIKATFSGAGLVLRTAPYRSEKGVILGEPHTLTSGAAFTNFNYANYFELTALPAGTATVIESIEMTYTCESGYNVKDLNGVYTGVGNDSYTWKLTVDDGDVTLESLDKLSNDSFDGTIAMTSASSATLTFAGGNLVLALSNDFVSLDYSSKTHAGLPQISFNRVFNVENFEAYSGSGQGYTNSTTKYQTSNLRSAFYADYYTGKDSGEIGGSGWPIMTSDDNMTYTSNKGHNNSKAGVFKFSNGIGMRYISMNELYGVRSLIGKASAGTVLSVWARGAYTSTSLNANHASNTSMKFYAFYNTGLTPATQSTNRESFDFTVVAGDTWQHFEFALTEGRSYYGFGFYANQSSGSTQYVPIDDIQIYTASPYAEYVAPVAATGVTLSEDSLELTVGGTGMLTATVAPNDATNKNVTWESSNTDVATVENGTVTAVAAGNATITVTTEDGGFTDTCDVTVTVPLVHYPSGTFMATVSGFTIVISIGTQANELVAVRFSTTDAAATGITYNSGNNTFSIPTTGSVKGYSIGTITGTYDYNNNRLTNVNCSGQVSAVVSDVTLTRPASNFYSCDGTTDQLRTIFKRRYNSGGWQVDTGNDDRITSNTTEYVSGGGSVKRKGWNGGAVALNFLNDFSPAIEVTSVQFWVYNPSGSDITIRMWYYLAANLNSNGETGSVTAKAGQWTYVAMGFGIQNGNEFTPRTIYNFQIADFTNSGAYLSFDDILFF